MRGTSDGLRNCWLPQPGSLKPSVERKGRPISRGSSLRTSTRGWNAAWLCSRRVPNETNMDPAGTGGEYLGRIHGEAARQAHGADSHGGELRSAPQELVGRSVSLGWSDSRRLPRG